MDYSMTGKIRERTGNRNPHFVPAEDFDTQDGNILVINAGVPADIIRNIADLAQDDHMRQREAIIKFDDPEKDKILLPGIFPKMTESPECV
jgi:crotonobetainyl-CoA:carnitine CoA-transferase CaiB-like acyl-CoA transferase